MEYMLNRSNYRLLNSEDILFLIKELRVIGNVDTNQINGTSLDITLGNEVRTENWSEVTSLSERESIFNDPIKMEADGYMLEPGEFILAHSREIFNLPEFISAELKLKSSIARLGLENLMAGWCDPGWTDSALTLELKNMTKQHSILLKPGDKIGQMIFFYHKPVPEEYLYTHKGHYNNQRGAVQAKKV